MTTTSANFVRCHAPGHAGDAGAVAGARHGAAVDRARRALSLSRHRDPDLVDLRAGLQSGARHRRAAVVRPRRLFRHRRLCLRPLPVQRRRQSLGLPRGGACRRRAGRRAGGAVHLAPARHLLRLHDHRLRPDLLDARDQVAQDHRRRGRAAEDRAAAGGFRRRLVRSHRQRGVLLFRAGRCLRSPSWRCGGWCIRPTAASSPRSARAKPAPRISAITSGSTRPRSSRCRRRCRDWPAACSRWRSSPLSPT